QIADADAGRAGAQEQDARLGQLRVDDLQGGGQPRERDARCALDVIVVAQHLVFIPGEQPDRIRALPVLEMDATTGEYLLHGLDEFVGESVDLVLRRRGLAQAKVKRI